MVFFTAFSFLQKVADLKNNDRCAECFDANFEHLNSCAWCFAQRLAFSKKLPISSNGTVAQGVLANLKQTANRITLNIYSSKRIVAHGDLHMV